MKKKHVLVLVVSLVVALAALILWVPNIAVDANTPEWLESLITSTAAFRDAFNSTTIIVIGLGMVAALLFFQYSKDKQNKNFLLVLTIAILTFGAYLLFAPGIAAAFSDQVWLENFADFAVQVNDYIDTNSGFLTFAGLASVLVFMGYKSTTK